MRLALRTILGRAARLRCPNCGEGRVFRGLLAVRPECSRCALPFFRESGYFVGSIYVNVVLTEFIMLIAYVISMFLPPLFHLDWPAEFALWMFAAVMVSLILTRWTRSFWLAVDFWLEPWPPQASPTSPSKEVLR